MQGAAGNDQHKRAAVAQPDNDHGNRPAQQDLQWRLRGGKHERKEVVIVVQPFECLADGAEVEVEPKDVDCGEAC